ncbi:MAG: uncharacterized protein QOJ07_3613 [Thermoleophilaceae bacterium]|nr:uncharacterized protein [Thermoleophilaceae bacterium]
MAATTAGAAGALAWWALWHEPRSVVLRRRDLALADWPAALGGLTVAVIADLHTGAPHVSARRVGRLVARVNAARPDLVVLLGDYADPNVVGGHRVEPGRVAAELARLEAPLGRYAVLGNNDWDDHGARMPRALRGEGITVLENEAVEVFAAAAPLWVAGVADAATRTARIGEALADVPEDAAVLVLTHHPDVFARVPRRVALTFAGHTHGSQIDLPLVRDRVTPSRHGADYTGHVEEDGRRMFVSPGVGTSRLPIRIGARPEVTLLRLEARPA